jgi:NitT/TauT family transport system permease protein
VIWVGFGFDAKVWMVFVSASVMILLITLEGVKTVDDSLVRVARSYGGSRKDIYVKVVLPFIVPVIANAIRNGIGTGIVAVMVVEMFSASGGIGAQVMRASHSYDGPRLFAFIIVLVAVSLGLIILSLRVEARVSHWREEIRA